MAQQGAGEIKSHRRCAHCASSWRVVASQWSSCLAATRRTVVLAPLAGGGSGVASYTFGVNRPKAPRGEWESHESKQQRSERHGPGAKPCKRGDPKRILPPGPGRPTYHREVAADARTRAVTK